jgi:Methylamine utilisation protein MauE.
MAQIAKVKFVWRIADVIVGGIFIYAGAIKALDPIRFANDIDNYKILPWTIAAGLAFYLPWLEILCGVALIVHRLYLGGLSVLTALTSIFIVASIAAKVAASISPVVASVTPAKSWNFSGHLALDLAILTALLALYFKLRLEIDCKMPSNSC